MKKHPTTRPARRASIWSNLVLAFLVFGLPVGLKLFLQNARAASSERIKSTESMIVPRYGHTSTVYSDGRVLISGGYDRFNHPVNTQEVFDPTNHTFHELVPGELDGATIVETPGPLSGPPGYDMGIDLINGDALYFGLDGAGLVYGTNNTIVPLTDTNSAVLYRANASVAELATDKKILIAGGLDKNNAVFADAALFNPAKVSTDYDDYPPGTPVGINGSGYRPGETVRWQVLHTDGGDNDTSSTGIHAPRDTTADANGNFSVIWDIPANEDELGATLEVTATGQTSGLIAQTRFTDSRAGLWG